MADSRGFNNSNPWSDAFDSGPTRLFQVARRFAYKLQKLAHLPAHNKLYIDIASVDDNPVDNQLLSSLTRPARASNSRKYLPVNLAHVKPAVTADKLDYHIELTPHKRTII